MHTQQKEKLKYGELNIKLKIILKRCILNFIITNMIIMQPQELVQAHQLLKKIKLQINQEKLIQKSVKLTITINIFNQLYQNKKANKVTQFVIFQVKPFIKITIQRQTNQQAKQFQILFKKLYETLIQILKSQQQQLINEILSISFITTVNNNIFTLFITTNNKQLVQLIQSCSQMMNQALKQQINCKIQYKHHMNFDFNKFISQQYYNFYDIIVKNCQVSIKWTIWDLFNNLRNIIIKTKLLNKLKTNPEIPQLFIIALLYCQKFTGSLQFQNTSTQTQQIQSKHQIVKFLQIIKQQIQSLQQSSGLNIFGLIKQLNGKINLQAGIKDWKLNLQIQIEGLTKLLFQDIKVAVNQDYD